jgi:hypothetical protein
VGAGACGSIKAAALRMIQQKKVGKVESTACRNLEVGDGITVDNRQVGFSVCVPDRCGDGRHLLLAGNCSTATARLQDDGEVINEASAAFKGVDGVVGGYRRSPWL